MFVKYFNLSEQPFGSTPDPRFLFQSDSHREALASLYCAFYANRGFTALIAEPGMGKTTLLFEFLERMRGCAKTVFLFNTFCGPDDIVTYILRDSGIVPGPTVADRYQQINDMLSAEAKAGRPVVLVVDEAQNLSPHTLEGIRLLTNFETARSKLIQVVLTGQPQLAEMLARPELSQLRQRISTISRIKPFSAEETRSYIRHRLKFAGHGEADLFAAAALDLIAEASAGNPRVINTLCFNSLCLCRARKASLVDDAMVREAIEDLRLPEYRHDSVLSSAPPPTFEPPLTSRRSSSRRGTQLAFAIVILVGLCTAVFGQRLWNAQIGSLASAALARLIPAALAKAAPDPTMPNQSLSLSQLGDDRQISVSKPEVALDFPGKSDHGPRSVRIAEGDTLIRIATAHFGTFNSAILRQMQELNPRLIDPDHIEVGQIIRLPMPTTQTAQLASMRN